MDRSIVKGWNVHYETLQEAEEAARLKAEKEKLEKEIEDEGQGPLGQQDGEQEPPGNSIEMSEDSYNSKTGSYSGYYGKKPIQDESKKEQINAILGEKKAAFDAALSELQAQGSSN